jgi:glycosyltransferase involved in cell wall biosynthesis
LRQLKRLYYSPASSLFERKYRADETFNIRSASMLLTNSAFSRGLLERAYGVAASVVYPGINTCVFSPSDTEEGDYVFCAAALIYTKGHRFVVRALGQIPPERRPALLIAANAIDPHERAVVEELARRVDVQLRIEQMQDDRRLVEAYSRARAFVYAPIQEALGLAPLEAMACGTPVVAVGDGGVKETVLSGVTGWVVERNERAFGRTLDRLLCDGAARRRMGEAAVDYVRSRWTWQQAVDTLERHFAQLVRRSVSQDAQP